MSQKPRFLVLGATAKTGRRVAEKLQNLGHSVVAVSRSTTPAFDWTKPDTWDAVLHDIDAVYVTFQPDLAVPGSDKIIADFAKRAVSHGVKHLVMLSGRGEEAAEDAEDALRTSGADWTILRANWFFQNFSEDFFLPYLIQGTLALPAGNTPEPFIDTDDIADCAVEALLNPAHIGKTYTLSGAEALTFAEATAIIADAAKRDIVFHPITLEQLDMGLVMDGVPDDGRDLIRYLFSEVLDGRNSAPTDDVQRILGRAPKSFGTYASNAAKTGVWDAQESN